jgi:hypothetical protein
MDQRIIEWLLEGPAWMRFAVETHLLDGRPDEGAALRETSIQRLLRRLKDERVGIRALETGKVTWAETGNAYWDLFFLTDIGLTAQQMRITDEIEEFLERQLPDGTFVTEDDHASNWFCVSGIFLSGVARAGYREHPRMRACVHYILGAQRSDGWHCGLDHVSGGKYEGAESCPMDNLNILQLLGQYEEFRRDSRFNDAINLLLDHWMRRDEKWRLTGFGIGKRYKTIEYPAVKYGILRVLDVVSLFPYAAGREGFRDMLEFVGRKSVNGRFLAESAREAYADFDFGQTREPSRWLTFLIERVKKRAWGQTQT